MATPWSVKETRLGWDSQTRGEKLVSGDTAVEKERRCSLSSQIWADRTRKYVAAMSGWSKRYVDQSGLDWRSPTWATNCRRNIELRSANGKAVCNAANIWLLIATACSASVAADDLSVGVGGAEKLQNSWTF